MTHCSRCVLSDNIPSVSIGNSGVCNYCSTYRQTGTPCAEGDREVERIVRRCRDRKYQAVMAYSGGKDSSYTLKLLKERFNMSILAVTFNNGFLSKYCFGNIGTVCDCVGVDSLIVSYPSGMMAQMFTFIEGADVFPPRSMERASAICSLCIALVKNLLYREAIIRGIPLVCFGWTPGQVSTARPLLKMGAGMIERSFKALRDAVTGSLGSEYGRFFLSRDFIMENENRIPYLYYPFVNNRYDESRIYAEITKMGWTAPEKTDGSSSNCMLNSYANRSHMERYGFHPYAFELSSLVREGYLSREEARERLERRGDEKTCERIAQVLRSRAGRKEDTGGRYSGEVV